MKWQAFKAFLLIAGACYVISWLTSMYLVLPLAVACCMIVYFGVRR